MNLQAHLVFRLHYKDRLEWAKERKQVLIEYSEQAEEVLATIDSIEYRAFEAGCAQITELSKTIVKAVENVGGDLLEVLKGKLFVAIKEFHTSAFDEDTGLQPNAPEWPILQTMLLAAHEALPTNEMFDLQTAVGKTMASNKAGIINSLHVPWNLISCITFAT